MASPAPKKGGGRERLRSQLARLASTDWQMLQARRPLSFIYFPFHWVRCPFKWGRWCWLANTGAGSLLISELVNFTLFPLHFPSSWGGSGWLYSRCRRCQRGPELGKDPQHRGRRGAAGKGAGATHAPPPQSRSSRRRDARSAPSRDRQSRRPPASPPTSRGHSPGAGGGRRPRGAEWGRGWVPPPPRSCSSARFA